MDLMHLARDLVTSPAVYALIFAFALLDAFVPIVPSETLIVTAGVFAVSGTPILPLVILAGAAGAFAGDHIAYQLGRVLPRRFATRIAPHLRERGGTLLVTARFIPGGRTAVTAACGATGYPSPRFAAFAALAGVLWATYSAMLGYLGGAAFESNPALGLGLGLGLALGVTATIELVRHFRRSAGSRRHRADPAARQA